MINYIKGKLTDINDNTVVVETAGLGYELNVSLYCQKSLGEIGSDVKIFTYMHVREDGVSLYGFLSKAERNMFLRLISVSGIGPKVSIGILSGMSLKDLADSVATGNTKQLSTVKGIGKKTAERIVLELSDKVRAEFDVSIDAISLENGAHIANLADDDAVLALISLGYNKSEAVKAVAKVATVGMTTEDIIFKVLKG